MSSIQSADLKNFLSDCIRSIKQTHPNLSSVQIAKRLNLTTSTFSRFENKETSRPTFSSALKIVREACSDEDLQNFIKNHYPEMFSEFEKTYTGNSHLNFLPEEAESYLQDVNTYEIMMLITSNESIHKTTIKEEFGNKGLAIVKRLSSKGILREQGDNYSLGKENFNFGQETVQKLLLNLIEKSYNLEAFGTHTNWASIQYQSVDKNKVNPLIREIYKKANAEIREVLQNPYNKGNDILWTGLAYDSLLNKHVNYKEVM